MIITFVGHKNLILTDGLRAKIQKTILENLIEEDTVFYCGGYGAFDNVCAGIVSSLKAMHPTIRSYFVTPYVTESHQKRIQLLKDTGYYDDVLYPPLEKTPYRYAILKRNEFMINAADLVIAYVENTWGGAFTTLEFARRKKKRIINLFKK